MKKKAIAPVNIALIKYWGKKDEKINLPANNSISVNLSSLYTTTSVEFSNRFLDDEIFINNQMVQEKERERVINHLNLIRKIANKDLKARVVSENNFPKGSGLASSASGFAALTLAACSALDLNLSQKQLSVLARLGSGSACRSIPDGFVEWEKGYDSESSYAYTIFPENWWDIRIIVVIFDHQEKKVSSTDGHKLAKTSIFFRRRINYIDKKLNYLKETIKKKDFKTFGEIVEAEALEMHAIMLTSLPSLIYWQPETLKLIKYLKDLRSEGLFVYFTIDAGPNLIIFSQKKDKDILIKKLKSFREVKKIIVNEPTKGARLVY